MDINKYKNIISHTYLFNDFSPNEITLIFDTKYYNVGSYEKGSIIYLQNEICNTIDILLEGEVVIQKIDENGDILTITTLHSENILGGNIAFSKNNVYPMTVVAKSNCKILKIKKELLLNLCQDNRAFLTKFLGTISDNALILTDKIKFMSMKSIRDKITEFLAFEYYKQNNTNIKLDITKKELAEKFGVQRPSLFRELKKMKEEGLIDYDSRQIKILDENIYRK